MSDIMWAEASGDMEADQDSQRFARAKVEASAYWPFLADSATPGEFTRRQALVSGEFRTVLARSVEAEHLEDIHSRVTASQAADFDLVHGQRVAKQDAQRAVKAAVKTALMLNADSLVKKVDGTHYTISDKAGNLIAEMTYSPGDVMHQTITPVYQDSEGQLSAMLMGMSKPARDGAKSSSRTAGKQSAPFAGRTAERYTVEPHGGSMFDSEANSTWDVMDGEQWVNTYATSDNANEKATELNDYDGPTNGSAPDLHTMSSRTAGLSVGDKVWTYGMGKNHIGTYEGVGASDWFFGTGETNLAKVKYADGSTATLNPGIVVPLSVAQSSYHLVDASGQIVAGGTGWDEARIKTIQDHFPNATIQKGIGKTSARTAGLMGVYDDGIISVYDDSQGQNSMPVWEGEADNISQVPGIVGDAGFPIMGQIEHAPDDTYHFALGHTMTASRKTSSAHAGLAQAVLAEHSTIYRTATRQQQGQATTALLRAYASSGERDIYAFGERWVRQAAATSPGDVGFGSVYGGSEPSYTTPDGPVWMYRKGQRVRFYNAQGAQVGPEQSNVAPAAAYAMDQGWESPGLSGLSPIGASKTAAPANPYMQSGPGNPTLPVAQTPAAPAAMPGADMAGHRAQDADGDAQPDMAADDGTMTNRRSAPSTGTMASWRQPAPQTQALAQVRSKVNEIVGSLVSEQSMDVESAKVVAKETVGNYPAMVSGLSREMVTASLGQI